MAGEVEGPRYWAFISYSHRDAAFGRKLHRQLETYVLPRRLIGRTTKQGMVPRRLAPIFRDREELPAASDLSTEVRAALAQSKSLVVVCSPHAAASEWVSREIELFRALHPDCPILAAIHAGDPGECFPAPLLGTGPEGERIEPLAADFRPNQDGARLGLLKLVAGIAGLGLDELTQRDAQRHRDRVTAVTVVSLSVAVLMGAMTAVALKARTEAEHERSEAEGLVEYMLTDLRDRLKGVGRLDVMTAVNERALEYYKDQDLATLPVDSLELRARILHAMGEDDENRGDHKDAVAKFGEAERTTAELLAKAPNDPERIFDHAQSVYWIGFEDLQQGRRASARTHFLEYRDLSAQMIALAPTRTKYRLELAYAEADLCTLALTKPYDPKGALRDCNSALADTEFAARHLDEENGSAHARRLIIKEVINSHANLADADLLNHDLQGARREREVELALVEREMAADPKNLDFEYSWIVIQEMLGYIDRKQGDTNAARVKLKAALDLALRMTKYDPANQEWTKSRDQVIEDLNQLQR